MILIWILVARIALAAAGDGWEAKVKSQYYNADLDASFLNLRTDSEPKSGKKLGVGYYDLDGGGAGGLFIEFAAEGMMYRQYRCDMYSAYRPFPANANVPGTQKQEWMIEKRGYNTKVYCNGKLVLDLIVSSDTCPDYSSWEKYWSRTADKFEFFSTDTATTSFYIGTTNACADSPCTHYCYNTGDDANPYTCGCPDGLSNDEYCGEVGQDVTDEVEQDVADEEDCAKTFTCEYSKATVHAVSVALFASLLAIAQFF